MNSAKPRRHEWRLDPDTKLLGLGLITVTAVLVALRIEATAVVGFGDSEALYAAYALHPQPAYLDHPGPTAGAPPPRPPRRISSRPYVRRFFRSP